MWSSDARVVGVGWTKGGTMRRRIVLVVLLGAAAGSSPAEAQAVPDEKAAVLATFEVLRQALNAGNAQSFVDNVTDDFMLLDMALFPVNGASR
jgi:hypothetical protein